MLEKLNRLKNWQASVIIIVVGFAVFWTGLNNPFQGDDIAQIVNNVPVHSIGNIRLFFEGGTFYAGNGLAPLSGNYYRPLMTTTFSLLYTLFGAHPLYFHLFQVLLAIGSSMLLYLFFRYSFKPLLALFLVLILLVHPIDSEIAFAIPVMQDALFFFFGMLALYLLIRFRSVKSLIIVVMCLLLSLLAKETAVLFIGVCFLYLWWWDRKRLIAFGSIFVLPMAAYLLLRSSAIGLAASNPKTGPIDALGLMGRLMTAPSIMEFYITKFIFPWKLADVYFWVYPHFSVRHVLVPLLFDLLFVALIVYGAIMVRKKATSAMWYTYCFFAIWLGVSLLFILQIFPLDCTASEPWFYFSMAGLLGLIGVVMTVFPLRLHSNWLILVAVVLLAVLGLRTSFRGRDWSNAYTLAYKDVSVSSDDYGDYTTLAGYTLTQGNFSAAEQYAMHSVRIYPNPAGYSDLGLALADSGDIQGAMQAYTAGLKLTTTEVLYENIGALSLVYGRPAVEQQSLEKMLITFPKDGKLWFDLALLEDKYGDTAGAKVAIQNAIQNGQASPDIYEYIMTNQPFNVTEYGETIVIHS